MRPEQSNSNDVATPQLTSTPQHRADPSCFELLNLLRRRLTVARSHIVAHATIAQKDETGKFSWVEFDPEFHSHLVKCAFSLLDAPITTSAQRIYKKSIFVFILELLNRESEDTFFVPKHGYAKDNCANRERKRIARKRARAAKRERTREANKSLESPPSDPTPLANAKERRCEVCGRLFQSRKTLSRHTCVSKGIADAKTGKKVETPTPTENSSAALPEVAILKDQIPTPPTVNPIPDSDPVISTQKELPTPCGMFMEWWTAKNPGRVLICEGLRGERCDKPATYVKMRGNYMTACYPKCAWHVGSEDMIIPDRFLRNSDATPPTTP